MMGNKWETRALGEVSNNFDSIRVPVKESDRRIGHYPYYGASGIVDHIDGYLFDGEYLLVAEDGENLRTKQTPVAFLAKGQFWVNNHAHIIQGNSHADTKFLMYALQQADISGYLTGSTMPKLTQGNMNRIPVPVPPLSEQKAISDILGSLDDKIELIRRTNETLEAMARAIFKSWFIDFDPVHAKSKGRQPHGMDTETAKFFPSSFVESEIGRIPKGWKLVPFSETVDILSGGTPKTTVAEFWGGDIPWFSVVDDPNDSDVFVVATEKTITQSGVNSSATQVLPVGTTIISARGTVGKVCITGVPTAMNQSCYGLRGKAGNKGGFTYYSTLFLVSTLQNHAHGSVFATITRNTFDGVTVVAPSQPIIKAFENAIEPLFDRIHSNLLEGRLLATARDALLPRLLSGELLIKDAV